MEFEQFAEAFAKHVKDALDRTGTPPERVEIINEKLVASFADSQLSPRADLQSIYDMHNKGWSMPLLANRLGREIEQMHGRVAGIHPLAQDEARSHLFCAVINAEQNNELLAHAPHERLEDLAVVVRYHVADVGSFLVTDSVCQAMHMTGNEVLDAAHHNTDCQDYSCRDVEDVLRELLLGQSLPEEYVDEYLHQMDTNGTDRLYVLTNTSQIDGAAALTCKSALRQAREQLGEDYYILPSSVHEVLLLRQSAVDDPSLLEDLVASINHNVVEEKERLSDHVYEYNGKTQQIHLVTGQSEQNLAEVPEEVRSPVSGRGR